MNEKPKRKKPTKRARLVSLVVMILCIISVPWWLDDWRRDLTSNKAKFDESATDPNLRPPVVADSVDQVADKIKRWVDSMSNWTVESEDQSDRVRSLHLVRTTRVLQFADDITVQLTPMEDGTRVDAQSESRVGVGDLGQNPRNLRELRQAVGSDRP